jgi:hypothetical protein
MCKELRYFITCHLISGVLFTMLWACVLAQQSVPNSLSDSVLSVTKGTTQFALELLQVSQLCFHKCWWFPVDMIVVGFVPIQCNIKFSFGSGKL